MKEFTLNEAKLGKPVCTRTGYKARIICWNRKNSSYPIVALVTDNNDAEWLREYTMNGGYRSDGLASDSDLVMVSEKHIAYANLFKDTKTGFTWLGTLHATEEAALAGKLNESYLKTIKVEWED